MDVGTWILAGATVVMAAATVYLGKQSARVATQAANEATATLALVEETRRDRELGVQPILRAISSGSNDYGPSVVLENIGSGPALRTVVFIWAQGALHWSTDANIAIAAGEHGPGMGLTGQVGAAARSVKGVLGSERTDQDQWAYCIDQLGNMLAFNLRTGEPPLRAHSEEIYDIEWSAAVRRFRGQNIPD